MTALLPILFALEGDWGDIRAVLVVVVSFVVLIGSIYMLLASNLGARVGYLVLMVSLSAFMIIFSLMWLVGAPGTVPGLGPRGPEPHWVPFKTDSAFAADFTEPLRSFPSGWDVPGQQYPGNIDSTGEFDTVKSGIIEALARDAEEKGLDATRAADWDFRRAGTEAPLPGQEELPQADARFLQDGNNLLFGVTIPATDKHREVTVFAMRDKGTVFIYSLYFLVASIIGFAVHLWLLARYEVRQKQKYGDEALV